jgi:putative ABC transport system substrate-binding protein
VKRREFITLLGGAAVAWPLAARAAVRTHTAHRRAHGYSRGRTGITGRNVQIDYRWSAGDAARLRRYCAAENSVPSLTNKPAPRPLLSR